MSEWLRAIIGIRILANDGIGVAACELTVADGIVPFPMRGDTARGNRILDPLCWRTTDPFVPIGRPDEGLYFAPYASIGEPNPRHALVAMISDAFRAQDADGWGTDESSFLYALDGSFRHITAQWAIPHVIDHYRKRIAATRDALLQVVGTGAATRALARVRHDTVKCADATVVARDVVEGIADRSLTIYDAGLALRPWREGVEPRPMRAVLSETLSRGAEALAREVSDLNETLHAQAALLSAHANLRLQPLIIALALISALVGGVAAEPVVREMLGSTRPSSVPACAHGRRTDLHETERHRSAGRGRRPMVRAEDGSGEMDTTSGDHFVCGQKMELVYHVPELRPEMDGPWRGEAEKIAWTDRATGLSCLCRRDAGGHLWGFVAVRIGHPLFGVGAGSIPRTMIKVHGGLRYSAPCERDNLEALTICDVAGNLAAHDETDRKWWFGFACDGLHDLIPNLPAHAERAREHEALQTYRNEPYVYIQATDLAAQLFALANGER